MAVPTAWTAWPFARAIGLAESRPLLVSDTERDEPKTALYHAATALVRSEYNVERNYLTAAINTLSESQGRRLVLEKPQGLNEAQLQRFEYFDPATGQDLWDTIRLPKRRPPGPAMPMTSHFDYQTFLIGQRKLLTRGLKTALDLGAQIVDAADHVAAEYTLASSTMPSSPFMLQEAAVRASWQELGQTWETASAAYSSMPTQWYSSPFTPAYLGLLPKWETEVDSTWQVKDYATIVLIGYVFVCMSLESDRGSGDLASVADQIGKTRDALWSLIFIAAHGQIVVSNADAAVKQKVKDRDVWDLVLGCTSEQFRDRFEASLDDWWGTKKHIVLALCGGPALTHLCQRWKRPYLAVEAFVACFICHMIYGVLVDPQGCASAAASDVVACLFGY